MIGRVITSVLFVGERRVITFEMNYDRIQELGILKDQDSRHLAICLMGEILSMTPMPPLSSIDAHSGKTLSAIIKDSAMTIMEMPTVRKLKDYPKSVVMIGKSPNGLTLINGGGGAAHEHHGDIIRRNSASISMMMERLAEDSNLRASFNAFLGSAAPDGRDPGSALSVDI